MTRYLSGAIDATLTTGSSNGVDRGARYVARCGHAVREATGLPVEVQFEPPRKLEVIDEVEIADNVRVQIARGQRSRDEQSLRGEEQRLAAYRERLAAEVDERAQRVAEKLRARPAAR